MNSSDAPPNTSPGDQTARAAHPILGAVLDALSRTGTLDPGALLRAQMSAEAQDDPRAALIMQLLQQQQAKPSENEAEEKEPDESEPDENEPSPEEAYSARNSRGDPAFRATALRDTMRKLYAELEALRVRNDALAAALGACYLCFGDDPLCNECGGHGRPGSLVPEPAAFRTYVLPALRRVRSIKAERGDAQRHPDRRAQAHSRPHTRNPEQAGETWQALD